MINRTTKLRWRRKFRRNRQKVEDIGVQAEEHIDKHFFRRLSRLVGVRRFVLGWVSLMLLTIVGISLQYRTLGHDFQSIVPVEGGIYNEGIIGAFTNANPIYATGSVDSSIAKLVFSGLLKYDQSNKLVGDLAQSYSSDESGAVYTVVLKDNIKWHDGQPLTAEDVVFTYQTIQNPDARSPLASSWSGIKVEAIDSKTIKFTLPNVLSAFPYSLTNGIVPKHKLKDVPISQLRAIKFNTQEPIGSGPFKWDDIEVSGESVEDREEKVGLIKNENYFGSAPKIQQIVIRAFRNEKAMIKSFNDKQLNAMSGLDSLPDNTDELTSVQEHNIPVTGEVAAFFKNSEGLLQDVKLRRALVSATNPGEVIAGLDYPAVVANSPLLKSQLGYDKTITQASNNLEQANKLLDEAGWITNQSTGFREKDGKKLSIKLTSRNTSEYSYVAQKLQSQWRAVGVDLQPILQTSDDFEGTLTRHDYEILLYGISLGLDPDVFAYWHSSQADIRSASRLNFSEYKSSTADKSLEAGRTRTDPSIRAIKYKPFLESWRNDAPAVVFYQPRYLYITRGALHGFSPTSINNATDRFATVNDWMIREEKTNK